MFSSQAGETEWLVVKCLHTYSLKRQGATAMYDNDDDRNRYEQESGRERAKSWCPSCGRDTYQESWAGVSGCWSCNPDGWAGR